MIVQLGKMKYTAQQVSMCVLIGYVHVVNLFSQVENYSER